jgi:hypothetical protein
VPFSAVRLEAARVACRFFIRELAVEVRGGFKRLEGGDATVAIASRQSRELVPRDMLAARSLSDQTG